MADVERPLLRQGALDHVGDPARAVIAAARSQLLLWVDVAASHLENPDMENIIEDLIHQDPLFARVKELPGKLLQREMFFVKNSIEGMLGYLREKSRG